MEQQEDGFPPGTPVLLRSLPGGRVGTVGAFLVVEDSPDLLALYIAPGFPCKRRTGVRGGPGGRMLLVDSGEHEDWTWGRTRALTLYRPGGGHAVRLFWNAADNTLLSWYIDLWEPVRRTPLGFDTRDLVLDVVVAADRSSWKWKDEEELDWSVREGRLTQEQVAAIRGEGERAARTLTETDCYREWETWTPDPSWPVPAIPADWKMIFP